MSKPADYPIRWERGFGWGSWAYVWQLVFPPEKVIPGYELLRVRHVGGPWRWLYCKAQRLRWAMRGPIS